VPPPWDLVRRAYSMPPLTIPKRNRRCVAGPTDLFLQRQDFLRFRPRNGPTKTRSVPRTANGVLDTAADVENRLAASDAFVLQALKDPDLSEEEKKKWRNRWSADPQNRDRGPPWAGDGSKAPETGAGATPPSRPPLP
jgi:hypothetical protein